jgi:signal transduction histidine kinase
LANCVAVSRGRRSAYVAALFAVSRPRMGVLRTTFGGFLMGSGIVALHYIAMDSMRLEGTCRYSPPLVVVSVVVAVVGSVLALRLVFFFREPTPGRKWRKLSGAMLMGVAIAGMHYTAMAASIFSRSEIHPELRHAVSVRTLGTTGMLIVPLMVLGISVLISMVYRLNQSFDQLRVLSRRLETVREDERRNMAREIHDELGQSLTAIKLELGSLVFEWPAREKPSKRAESITRLVDQAIQSVQKISTRLRPGILDSLGFVAAVEWAAEEFQTRTGTTCHVTLPEETLRIDGERGPLFSESFRRY